MYQSVCVEVSINRFVLWIWELEKGRFSNDENDLKDETVFKSYHSRTETWLNQFFSSRETDAHQLFLRIFSVTDVSL